MNAVFMPLMNKFQSTRPQGARPGSIICFTLTVQFQSTRPQGARPWPFSLQGVQQSFNPRARRGRDSSMSIFVNPRRLFQSTRPQGARLPSPLLPYSLAMFQSTRPQGARRLFVGCNAGARCFNPRARGGRDKEVQGDFMDMLVSIHAPVGGATYKT